MGYYATNEMQPARFSARQTVSPKTHTPDRHLHISGRRYYSPELGRWVSRDPIGERGGKNVYGFVGNNSVNQIDAKGLRITPHKNCLSAITEFWGRNPEWKDKVDDLAGGDPPCKLDIQCECCGAGSINGDCASKPDEQGNVKVRICEDRNLDLVARTIAHELVHFFDACGGPPIPCDGYNDDPLGGFKCDCANFLCKEMRAHMKSRECGGYDSCWNLIMQKGYWEKDPRCGMGNTQESVFAYIQQNNRCNLDAYADLPEPNYPPEFPVYPFQ